MTVEQLKELHKKSELAMEKTRKEAYIRINKSLHESDISCAEKTILSWALAAYYNIKIDMFETKED